MKQKTIEVNQRREVRADRQVGESKREEERQTERAGRQAKVTRRWAARQAGEGGDGTQMER